MGGKEIDTEIAFGSGRREREVTPETRLCMMGGGKVNVDWRASGVIEKDRSD